MAEHGTSFSLTITSHVSLSSDMRPVRTASIITFSILATAIGISRSNCSLASLVPAFLTYLIVPYFSVSSEKSKALLSFFSMKGEHLAGNPREIILLRTAKMGSMSSYIFAPISKGARTSKAEYSFQYFCASELFLSISSMVSSLKAQWNCFGG